MKVLPMKCQCQVLCLMVGLGQSSLLSHHECTNTLPANTFLNPQWFSLCPFRQHNMVYCHPPQWAHHSIFTNPTKANTVFYVTKILRFHLQKLSGELTGKNLSNKNCLQTKSSQSLVCLKITCRASANTHHRSHLQGILFRRSQAESENLHF